MRKKLIIANADSQENIIINSSEQEESPVASDTFPVENTYYTGDNLQFLNKIKTDSVDLIYFDPPYNTGRNFFDFDDRFKSIEDYLEFIKLRIKECSRCLKPGGNIIIHIEPRISHYFRIMCDGIFGSNNFKNEK